MGRNAFVDPATGERYVWHRNHSAEERSNASRAVNTRQIAASGWENIAPVRVQGADRPEVLTYTGKIDEPVQHETFLRFWDMSRHHTVIFEDFTGAQMEVLVTGYQHERQGVLRNSRGGDYSYAYTLEMEIVTEL